MVPLKMPLALVWKNSFVTGFELSANQYASLLINTVEQNYLDVQGKGWVIWCSGLRITDQSYVPSSNILIHFVCSSEIPETCAPSTTHQPLVNVYVLRVQQTERRRY